MATRSSGGGGNFFSRNIAQNYPDDCDMLFFCEKNAQTYRLCYKGAPISSKRCSPAEKNLMLMFSQVVHRTQLMDETVKQLDLNLGQLLRKADRTTERRETTPRVEQSQAASLVNGSGTATATPFVSPETAFDRDSYTANLPHATAESSQRLRRTPGERRRGPEPEDS